MGCCRSKPQCKDVNVEQSEPEIKYHYAPEPTKGKSSTLPAKGLVTTVSRRPTHVALFDYVARGDDELTFRAGDAFIVTEKGDEWWKAKCLRTNETGYSPSNYIGPINSHYGESWFAGCVGRMEANGMLLRKDNDKGTFLIRESQQNKGDFTLCVLDHNHDEGRTVKAYLIRQSQNEGKFYIYGDQEFRTLKELVKHYSEPSSDLCCRLTKPCARSTTAPSLPTIARNIFEVSRESIKFIEPIGQGSFGEVWRGLWNDNVEVAIKKLTPGKMTPGAFIEEANMMRDMRHKNLLQLQAVVVSSEPMLIVTEYMRLGSLQYYLRKGDGRNSTRTDHYDMAAQIAAGMAYIEKIKYVHRDLRTCNVLVGENNVYKVADFGLARILEDDIYNAAMDSQYPVKWTAPEGLTHMVFSIKSDVWSFGILLSEVVTKGGIPYPGMTNPEVEPALQGGYRMPRPANCDEEMYSMMLECWKQEPEDRPSFKSIRDYFEDRVGSYVCIHRITSIR